MAVTESVVIRPYIPESDYPAVKECLVEGNLFYESMDSSDRLNRAVAMSPGCILLAELGGIVVGTVIVQDQYGPMFFRLSVKQKHRGIGVGRKLNDAAKQRAKSQGFSQAHILVAESEQELQEIYRNWGWQDGNLYRWMWTDL